MKCPHCGGHYKYVPSVHYGEHGTNARTACGKRIREHSSLALTLDALKVECGQCRQSLAKRERISLKLSKIVTPV